MLPDCYQPMTLQKMVTQKEEEKDMALKKTKRVHPVYQSPTADTGHETSTTGDITKPVAVEAQLIQAEPTNSLTQSAGERTPRTSSLLEELEEILPSKTISKRGAALSIVNNRNGKRIKIANSILAQLDSPTAVRFLMNEEDQKVYILAAQANEVGYSLAGKPTKNTVYSVGLVDRLTSLFELDYSSRTSHSIGTWTLIEEEVKMIRIQSIEEVQED